MRTQVRLVAAILLASLVTAGPANAAPEPSPTPDVTVQAADAALLAELEEAVSGLHSRAAEINERLTAATTAYETGKADLAAKEAEAAAAEERADEAEERAEKARDVLGAFARASYQSGGVEELALMQFLTSSDPESAVRNAGYMNQVGRHKSSAMDRARADLARAERERSSADRLRNEAEQEAEALQTQLENVQAESLQAAEELTEKVAELDLVRIQVEEAALASQLLTEGGGAGELCATEAPSTYPTSQEWGGYANGLIPASALCKLSNGHQLRWDAATSLRALSAAYAAHFGTQLCMTDSYRDYAGQVDVFARKPGLAAQPGTSNHGWALAVDFCGGIETFGTPQHQWMVENAAQFGWFHPRWAQQGGSRPEAWHWEYGKIS